MLVNKDAYQRETLTNWPVRLPLIFQFIIQSYITIYGFLQNSTEAIQMDSRDLSQISDPGLEDFLFLVHACVQQWTRVPPPHPMKVTLLNCISIPYTYWTWHPLDSPPPPDEGGLTCISIPYTYWTWCWLYSSTTPPHEGGIINCISIPYYILTEHCILWMTPPPHKKKK